MYPISKKCTQPVKQAIEPTLKPFRLDIAEYATGKDVNELFGLPSFHLDQMGIFDLKNSSEGIIKYTKLNYIWGTFGYISLETFLPNMGDTEAAVKTLRGLLTNELKNTNGLIMDVRNNPGGAIQLAEKVPQLFSQGHVVPSTIRALNVLLNKRIFESGDKDFTGTPWPTIFNSTPVTSEWTQPSVMISNETLINEAGRAYFKPVAVLTNALCYSACELFVAAMQDWKLATIYGEGMNYHVIYLIHRSKLTICRPQDRRRRS